MANAAKVGVDWDLGDLYKGIDDPKINKDRKIIATKTKLFEKKYRGKINSKKVTSKILLQAILDYEVILEMLWVNASFPGLKHAKNTSDHKIGLTYSKSGEFATDIVTKFRWFELEILELPESDFTKLIKSPDLRDYLHFLKSERKFKPYILSEKEEILMTKKSLSGSKAFVNFFDKKSSSEQFELEVGGKVKKMSQSELTTIMASHKDRALREKATNVYAKKLADNEMFYTFVLNNLLLDKKINDEIRGYSYPQQATLLSYEIDKKTVDALSSAISNKRSICERYYRAKSKVLGHKLFEWDRYSSIYPERLQSFSWNEARDLVLSAFSSFDSELCDIAKKFFAEKWIDSRVTKGKKNGAFCSYITPAKHPYVLTNFNGTYDDVSTLAHELGHGIHAYLSRENALLNYNPSTATAEIASIFAESLLFDYVYKQTTDKKTKINLLGNKIQGSFATVFRQMAFYEFEQDIHNHRRTTGELATEEFNGYFQKRLQSMFGNGLTLTPQHRYWWMSVLHFYHYNFYVFTYAFGEALTSALYANYKKGDKDFVDNYKAALKSGGSKSPSQITKLMGVNISDEKFWVDGLSLLEDKVAEFEKLVSSSQTAPLA